MAREFVRMVEADSEFELAAPAPLNLVCFRHRGGDAANQEILDSVNGWGRIFLTHTKIDGKLTLRMSIGQARTEARHVRCAWDLIRSSRDS
jgi:aromatic-L-amino-acid decarboxylase